MKKLSILLLVAMFNIVALGQTQKDFKVWNPVMEAISKIESNHNSKAVSKSGKYVGYLQISPCVVNDVNNYLGKKVYTLKDRYDITKSKEMFILFQQKYNPTKDIKKAIRIWNGGPQGLTKNYTLTYYNKVYKVLINMC